MGGEWRRRGGPTYFRVGWIWAVPPQPEAPARRCYALLKRSAARLGTAPHHACRRGGGVGTPPRRGPCAGLRGAGSGGVAPPRGASRAAAAAGPPSPPAPPPSPPVRWRPHTSGSGSRMWDGRRRVRCGSRTCGGVAISLACAPPSAVRRADPAGRGVRPRTHAPDRHRATLPLSGLSAGARRPFRGGTGTWTHPGLAVARTGGGDGRGGRRRPAVTAAAAP